MSWFSGRLCCLCILFVFSVCLYQLSNLAKSTQQAMKFILEPRPFNPKAHLVAYGALDTPTWRWGGSHPPPAIATPWGKPQRGWFP